MPAERNGPQLTWANIIATLIFAAAAIGGFWTLIQTQITTIHREIATLSGREDRATASANEELQRHDAALKQELRALRNTLADMHRHTLMRQEFNTWQQERNKLIGQMLQRIDKLEKGK